MKAYKVELLVLDFDGIGKDEIRVEIENVNYPNDCLSPDVMSIKGNDKG